MCQLEIFPQFSPYWNENYVCFWLFTEDFQKSWKTQILPNFQPLKIIIVSKQHWFFELYYESLPVRIKTWFGSMAIEGGVGEHIPVWCCLAKAQSMTRLMMLCIANEISYPFSHVTREAAASGHHFHKAATLKCCPTVHDPDSNSTMATTTNA